MTTTVQRAHTIGSESAQPQTILIAGQWSGATASIPVIAPATGQSLGSISRGRTQDVDAAVKAARHALNAGEWGTVTPEVRGRLLVSLSRKVLEQLEPLAQIEAADTGKPLALARADIRALARYFEYYGGAADKFHGDVIPFDSRYNVSVQRVPLGVTAHIIPWNYPAQMLGRSISPALAMGNAVVLKPAEDACMSCLAVADLAAQVGFPPGAINVVTGLGEEAGAALSAHPDVNLVTFTGSCEVGALVQIAAAKHHVPVTLELGGKSPQIVFEDADLQAAAASVIKSITQNAGQTCSAGSRVLIQRSVVEPFMAHLTRGLQALRIGVPEDDADLGPVINARQQSRITRMIEECRAEGVPILTELELPVGLPPGGFYVSPIIFGPVDPHHRIAQEEVFGPVLCALIFEDEDEAIEIANGTDYGLVAGIWTKDGDRMARMAKKVHVGQVFINCYGAGGGVELPFGGMKHSGHGREKGLAGLEEMSTTKTVVHFHQ